MESALLCVEGLHVDIVSTTPVKHMVRNVSFSVQRGKTLCIVGESGCGKSLTALSLMSLLADGVVRRSTTLRFDGIDLAQLTERQWSDVRGARIAMIFKIR